MHVNLLQFSCSILSVFEILVYCMILCSIDVGGGVDGAWCVLMEVGVLNGGVYSIGGSLISRKVRCSRRIGGSGCKYIFWSSALRIS